MNGKRHDDRRRRKKNGSSRRLPVVKRVRKKKDLETKRRIDEEVRRKQEDILSQTRTVKMLEERLERLRWKKVQNASAIASRLRQDRETQRNDVISNMNAEEDARRQEMMASVVEEELSRPLEFAGTSPTRLYALETEQRRECERFERHLESIRKIARRVACAESTLRRAGDVNLSRR